MSIWYVLLVISINVALIVLWEMYKKRKFNRKLKEATDIQELIEKKQYDLALSKLKKAEKYYPPVAYEMMGECYYGMGDKVKAQEFYRQALAIDSTMAMAHVGIAQIEMDEGEYANAESSLRRALEIDKGNYIAMYHLARIYSIWGKYSDAAGLLEKAIASGLIVRDAYLMLRDYYESIGDYAAARRIDEQIELLNKRGN